MLTINEIFHSIQGESTHAGEPCVFVRLSACDLRCSWCDTPYAFHAGRKMTIEDVVSEVRSYGCPLVEVTGGEPLLQREVYPLMTRLLDEGFRVMLETGGHLSTEQVPDGVTSIIDVKCPASGEADKNHWPNLERLRPTDEVKFVVQDRADYLWARDVLERTGLAARRTVLFSPVFGQLDPKTLAAWLLEDGVRARLQLQLHKLIWDPAARGV
jgi:7-carboxy-7-deazaguanine synthase